MRKTKFGVYKTLLHTPILIVFVCHCTGKKAHHKLFVLTSFFWSPSILQLRSMKQARQEKFTLLCIGRAKQVIQVSQGCVSIGRDASTLYSISASSCGVTLGRETEGSKVSTTRFGEVVKICKIGIC